MLSSGRTDIGNWRTVNQDTFICESYPSGMILAVVCDGMGGAQGGGIASGLACSRFIESISPFLEKQPRREKLTRTDERNIKEALQNAVNEANSLVFDKGSERIDLTGMGTTIVAVLATEQALFTISVGDSRMYLYHEGHANQVTHDHSYVQYLIDIGKITKEEAKNAKNRNVITRAVGTDISVEGDVVITRLHKKSHRREYAALLCSDGLSNMLSEEEIEKALEGVFDIDTDRVLGHKCEDLVNLANDKGGFDNITAVLVTI